MENASAQNQLMPRTRMDEVFALAEEHNGLIWSDRVNQRNL
jgi:hypothetical protein